MKTRVERNTIDALMRALDKAVEFGAASARHACFAWRTNIAPVAPANDDHYPDRKYRKSTKKSAKVLTIHSILSNRYQNVLSIEIGRYAAWLLGFRPFFVPLIGCQNDTSPTSAY